jgi:hypothetical protein
MVQFSNAQLNNTHSEVRCQNSCLEMSIPRKYNIAFGEGVPLGDTSKVASMRLH